VSDPGLRKRIEVLSRTVWRNRFHMALDLGLSYPVIHRIIGGKANVPGRLLFALATHPRVDPLWLFGRKKRYRVRTVTTVTVEVTDDPVE
jgi:hypothetical protein